MLPAAYRLVVEAARKTTGISINQEQIYAAMEVVKNGRIVEQATGEGKSITKILAAYLRVLSGEQVHLAEAAASAPTADPVGEPVPAQGAHDGLLRPALEFNVVALDRHCRHFEGSV